MLPTFFFVLTILVKCKKKRINNVTVKGNILAGKYSCGEIFSRIWRFFFKLAGFSPQEYFPTSWIGNRVIWRAIIS